MTYYRALPPLSGDGYAGGMPGITSLTSGGSGRLISPFQGDIRVSGPQHVPSGCRCTWVPRYPGRCNTYGYYQLKFPYGRCPARHE